MTNIWVINFIMSREYGHIEIKGGQTPKWSEIKNWI